MAAQMKRNMELQYTVISTMQVVIHTPINLRTIALIFINNPAKLHHQKSTLLINELIKPVEKNGCFSSLEHFLLALYVTTPKKLMDVLFLILVLTNSKSV